MEFTVKNIISTIRQWLNPFSPLYVTRLSLLICSVLAVGGIVLGVIEGSLTVQTNGLISAIDIVNSLLFLSAVHRSVRSADVTYNYGYGKYESLAIIASAGLLTLVLGFTMYEAIIRFQDPVEIGKYYVLIAFSVISVLLMRRMAAVQKVYAERYHMPMLQYDSDLWRVDSIIEIGVLINLVIGYILRQLNADEIAKIIDSIAAVALLLIALKVPITHGKLALSQLLDKTLPDQVQFDILAVIAENINRMCEFKSVHTRQSGKDIFIELDLVMPFDYTLEETFALERDISKALIKRFPTAVPRVYVVPCPRDCIHSGKSFCPVKLAKEKEVKNLLNNEENSEAKSPESE
ncbi:MAG TPA: cation diffusion facilitator family transporter [Patescibacteria group bacterium]|nr:cation diffusion facilitator family transporter [Patescibacteria group bacterium]